MFDYIKTLKQLNNAENTYGKEIGNLNNTINELRNKIEFLENVEEESLEIIDDLNIKLDELKNKNNNEYLIKENSEIQDKIRNM